jgi:hypothetical protein
MPFGKGYAFWVWPVLTPACLDTAYSQKTRENIKNQTKCDVGFSIGQERKNICLPKGKRDSFSNEKGIPSVTRAKNLSWHGFNLGPFREKEVSKLAAEDLAIARFRRAGSCAWNTDTPLASGKGAAGALRRYPAPNPSHGASNGP